MKVIHVISGGDIGGARTHLLALSKELVKHIDMRIVCFIEGEFYHDAVKLGLPVTLIKQKTRPAVIFDKKLINYINEEKPDIVHSHGARANFSIYVNKKRIKCPKVTTMHSDYKEDFKDNFYKYVVFTFLNMISLKHFDNYIAVSDNFKEMLIERGYKEEKIYTTYNGVDFIEEVSTISRDEFAEKHNLMNVKDKRWIGLIARFELVKGVDVFIKSAKEVLNTRDDVHFIIAGDGTQKNALHKLADDLGIYDNISFIGFIDDVPSMLEHVEINVLTSHSESFTYSILEGARQKKATVVTAVGGLVKLIIDEETGLLAEDGNYVEVSEKIIRLIGNDEERAMLGENLHNFVKENFSTESMAKQHLDIYNEVIKCKTKS